MPYLDDLRGVLGSAADGRTDEDLLGLVSKATGRSMGQVADEYGYDPGKGSLTRERVSSGIDRYQAGLYDVGAQTAGALGLKNWSSFLDERRRANEVQAGVAAERSANLGGIDRFADVHGPGDFLNYAGGLAAQSLPYVGEALVGGMVGRAAIAGARGFGSAVGAVGASYPSSVGDILSNQREQAGTVDFGNAALLGLPYAALNMFGVEGVAARGQLARSGIRALDNMTGVGGVAARTGATVARTGIEEGISETGQEVFNQMGRIAVDPSATLTDPAAMERYGESFIGGATLGGLFGGAVGGWKRSAGYRPTLEETGNLLDPSAPVVPGSQVPTPPPGMNPMPPPGMNPMPPLDPAMVGAVPEALAGEAPPAPPEEPVIVAGVDAGATSSRTQELLQERQQAVDELNQFMGGVKPKGNQIEAYRDARRIRDAFSDEEFSELAAQIAAGDVKFARATIKKRQESKPKEAANVSVGDVPGAVAGGSGAGGGADVQGSVGDAGQPAGSPAGAGASPAPLAPVAPGRTSLPARVAAVQQPAGVGFTEAFGGLKDGGITEQLYAGLFQALVEDKNTYAGVKDPVLAKARPFYARGEITSPADLKALVESGYKKAPLTSHETPAKPAPKIVVKKSRKLDPATVTKEDVKQRLASLSDRDKQVVQSALGIDAEGHAVSQPASYDEIGKQHGISKQRVQMILANVGVNEKTIERFAGATMESVPLSELVAGAEEGAATGIRTMDRPSEGDDFIEAKTPAQQKLEGEATKLLKAADQGALPNPKLAVPESATERFLRRKQEERAAAKKAADEALEAKRQAYAAKLREAAPILNRDVLTEGQDNSPAFEQADREAAERDWAESRRAGDIEWKDLSKEQQERYITLWRANDQGLSGERGRDYLDHEFDALNHVIKAQRKTADTKPVGEARRVTGTGFNALNDPARQQVLQQRAVDRAIARRQGKEVPTQRIQVRSRINKALASMDAGRMSADELAAEMERLSEDLEGQALDRELSTKPRERGADYIRERLLQAKRRGDLSEQAVDFAEWFVLQNPSLVDDLGVSVRAPKRDGVSGNYDPVRRVATLMKESSNDGTAVHEVLHHLERMMPPELQGEVRATWHKALATEIKRAQKKGDPKVLAYLQRVLSAELTGNPREAQLAAEMVKKGEVPYDHYSYLNPSEFWAVNMAAHEQARFDARNSLWERAKLWLKDALEWAKMVLGLNSRTPLYRALRAVLDGDGQFQSTSMLAQGDTFNATEKADDADSNQPPGPQPGSARAGQSDAAVQTNVQARAAAGQGSNGGRVPPGTAVGADARGPQHGKEPAGLGDLPPAPGKPAKLKGWLDSIVAGKWRAAPWLLGALSTEQLAERMGRVLSPQAAKALRSFHQGMQRMAQRANQLITESDRVKRQWETLRSKHGAAQDEKFMDFMIESTRAGVFAMHPLDNDGPNKHLGKLVDKPDGTQERVYPDAVKIQHAQLAAQWKNLPLDYRAFFEALQKDFQAKYKAKVEGFRQNIVSGHYPQAGAVSGPSKDQIEQAARLAKKDRAAFRRQHAKSKLDVDTYRALWSDLDDHAREMPTQLQGPYFPLMRFGEHIVSLKSKAYRDAEAHLAALNKEVDALLADDNYASIDRLELERDEIERKLPKAKTDAEKLELRSRMVVIGRELEKLHEPIEAKRGERNKARTALSKLKGSERDYVVEFYESLGEATARKEQLDKHFADRSDVQVSYSLKDQYLREVDGVTPTYIKKVEERLGEDLPASDRARVRQTMRELYLQMLPETSAMKSQMRRKNVAGVRSDQGLRSYAASSVRDAWYISRLENREPVRSALNELRFSDTSTDAKLVGNELAKRIAQNWHFDNHQWMAAATNVTYLAYLGMSPAFIVTQVTQPWVISAPVMAARHGAATAGQLWRGWKQAGQLMRLNRKSDGSLNYSLNPEEGVKAKILTEGEAAMLRGMLDSGRIDITVTHDLGASAAGRSDGLLGKAVAISAWPAQQAELLNRVSTALAAYRMEKNRLMKDGTGEGAATTAAREYADKIVAETHLNYAPENKARFMHPNAFGGWGRLMWQFRSYQQGMLYLVFKNLWDGLKGDKEARRAFVYLAGMQLAVAGTSGLPIAAPAALVATLLYKAFTDDDDEKDLKEVYFQALGGGAFATAVTKGLPALAGVDLSKRLGMGNIMNPVPYVDDTKEGRDMVAAYWVAMSGGAFAGLLGNVAEGIKAADKGDWAKALAWTLPFKAGADVVRGANQALNGLVDSNGNTILAPEELGIEDVVTRMLGFPSAQVERTREQRNAFFEARQNRADARSAIVREMVQARLKGEAGDLQPMLDYNARHPDNRITMSDVLRQVKAKRDEARAMQRTGGIPVKKSDRALAREIGVE